MLAKQAIQFQEVQKIYFLEARSLLRPCYHVHINVAVSSFANMAIPKSDALQASWDISWQGIQRTVRTSQSHAPPEEQSWTKANRKHTRNSLTPRTPGICLGNERGLVRELDTTMNNGRPPKNCVSYRMVLAACCWKLPLGHWRLPRATVSCHHLSTCQVDTTRCTEQYRTWHADNLGRTLTKSAVLHAMSVLTKIFLLRWCALATTFTLALLFSQSWLWLVRRLFKKSAPTCKCFQICAWSPQLSRHGLQIRQYCQNSINLATRTRTYSDLQWLTVTYSDLRHISDILYLISSESARMIWRRATGLFLRIRGLLAGFIAALPGRQFEIGLGRIWFPTLPR